MSGVACEGSMQQHTDDVGHELLVVVVRAKHVDRTPHQASAEPISTPSHCIPLCTYALLNKTCRCSSLLDHASGCFLSYCTSGPDAPQEHLRCLLNRRKIGEVELDEERFLARLLFESLDRLVSSLFAPRGHVDFRIVLQEHLSITHAGR